MFDFSHLRSFAALETLAKHPVDLTECFTPERIRDFRAEAVGFKLLFGAERVDEKAMDELFRLADEANALASMQAMQRGEKVNTGENRAALHTAMRDQFGSPLAQEASDMAAKELTKLDHFLDKIGDRFTDVIQVGIGGSDLGPRALSIALQPFFQKGRRAHFISNVDPDDATAVLNSVDLKKSLIVVVSKSGSTLETLTNEAFVRDRLMRANLNPKEHMVAVTGEKSPMDNPAHYLQSFYMWDFVGGRYSATSMVGAVSLSFTLGFSSFRELLQGAHEMDRHALTPRNLPLTSALLGIWNRNFLHHETVAIIPYSQALARFPAHLQQLDMESNGKRVNKMGKAVTFPTGPIIWGEPGTNGQHSFYQLIHQGTTVVPLELIGFQKSQYGQDLEVEGTTSQQKLLANLYAQSIALATGQKNGNPNKVFPGNRPNRLLLGEQLTPFSLGALLSYYEHKVAFQGFIWNINSFDQEGVQLGKMVATKMLNAMQGKPFPLGQAYL